jgi:hypothetical protein
VGGADPPPAVREEVLFVVFDASSRREHLLYAARLEPAAPSLQIALPVPAAGGIEVLGAIDLPLALHTLAAPYELSTLGREPVRPARWSVRGVEITGRVVPLGAELPAGLPFDAGWVRSYAAGDGALALLSVNAPKDGRIELSMPVARISFSADKPVLSLREPPSPLPQDRPAEAAPEEPRKAAGPYTVEDIRAHPAGDAPSAATIDKVLRARTAPFASCYERFLDRSPGTPASVGLEVTLRPRGDIAAVRSTKSEGGDADLTSCLLAAVRRKQFPRMDAGWRFTAHVRFPPPRTPARVTHIAVLAAERWTWTNPPAWVTRVRELEPAWEDWGKVFTPEMREALGLRPPGRLWLSHYIDRSERRAGAADVTFAKAELPPDGEPGTLGYAHQKQRERAAAKREASGEASGAASGPAYGVRSSFWANRRWRHAIVAGLAALGAVVLALGLDRSR